MPLRLLKYLCKNLCMAESSGGGGKGIFAALGLLLAAAGVVATIVIGVQSHQDATSQNARSEGSSGNSSGNSAPTSPTSPPPSTATNLSGSGATVVHVPAPVMASFTVSTTAGFPGAGSQVGPDLYQVGGGGNNAEIAYNWHAVMSDGSSNTTATCQILATVTGPESVDSYRTSDCTDTSVNGFTGAANIFYVKTPGTYTVTVTDQLTNISAQHTFTVVP